jgi:hypothetical protein
MSYSSGSLVLKGGSTKISHNTYGSTNLTIDAAKGTVYGNKLTLDGSSWNWVFTHSGDTLIATTDYSTGDNATIKIKNFSNGAFSNGIDFGYGNVLSYAEVRKQAGWV